VRADPRRSKATFTRELLEPSPVNFLSPNFRNTGAPGPPPLGIEYSQNRGRRLLRWTSAQARIIDGSRFCGTGPGLPIGHYRQPRHLPRLGRQVVGDRRDFWASPARSSAFLRVPTAFGRAAANLGAEASSYLATIAEMTRAVQQTPRIRGVEWSKFDWNRWSKAHGDAERALICSKSRSYMFLPAVIRFCYALKQHSCSQLAQVDATSSVAMT
jgi:hypothetical protein